MWTQVTPGPTVPVARIEKKTGVIAENAAVMFGCALPMVTSFLLLVALPVISVLAL